MPSVFLWTYPSQSVKISIHSCTFSKNLPIRRLMPFQYVILIRFVLYYVINFFFLPLYNPNSTSLPNGASESPAILKCCFAQGMPTTVMQRSKPKSTCINHAHNPPQSNQIRFRGMRIQPVGQSVSLTVDPKGHRQSSPILNVCNYCCPVKLQRA